MLLRRDAPFLLIATLLIACGGVPGFVKSKTAGYLLFLAGVVIGAIVFAVAARRAAKADQSATAES